MEIRFVPLLRVKCTKFNRVKYYISQTRAFPRYVILFSIVFIFYGVKGFQRINITSGTGSIFMAYLLIFYFYRVFFFSTFRCISSVRSEKTVDDFFSIYQYANPSRYECLHSRKTSTSSRTKKKIIIIIRA